MLVLSRKVGQKLVIGDDIVVTITKTNSNRVRIGIEAPSEVKIIRAEIGGEHRLDQGSGAAGIDLSERFNTAAHCEG